MNLDLRNSDLRKIFLRPDAHFKKDFFSNVKNKQGDFKNFRAI